MRQRANIDELPAVAQWLFNARTRTGKSQEQIANAADIDTTYVSKIELGQKNPSRKVVQRLAEALLLDKSDAQAQKHLLNAGLKAAGFATQSEDNGKVKMSDYGIISAPGFDDLSDEHQRFVGETALAAAQATASNMIRMISGAFTDVDDDGNPFPETGKDK